jgi:hypothetical protein
MVPMMVATVAIYFFRSLYQSAVATTKANRINPPMPSPVSKHARSSIAPMSTYGVNIYRLPKLLYHPRLVTNHTGNLDLWASMLTV